MPISIPPVAYLVWADADGQHRSAILRRRHLAPACVRVTALLEQGITAEILSPQGKRMFPGKHRRRNNPHLREDGDRNLPSTLTR